MTIIILLSIFLLSAISGAAWGLHEKTAALQSFTMKAKR